MQFDNSLKIGTLELRFQRGPRRVDAKVTEGEAAVVLHGQVVDHGLVVLADLHQHAPGPGQLGTQHAAVGSPGPDLGRFSFTRFGPLSVRSSPGAIPNGSGPCCGGGPSTRCWRILGSGSAEEAAGCLSDLGGGCAACSSSGRFAAAGADASWRPRCVSGGRFSETSSQLLFLPLAFLGAGAAGALPVGRLLYFHRLRFCSGDGPAQNKVSKK